MKTFLASLGRLWTRYPTELQELVTHFAGVKPPAIPPELKHKLKIWTFIAGNLFIVL